MARPGEPRQEPTVREKAATRTETPPTGTVLTGVPLDSDVFVEILRGNPTGRPKRGLLFPRGTLLAMLLGWSLASPLGSMGAVETRLPSKQSCSIAPEPHEDPKSIVRIWRRTRKQRALRKLYVAPGWSSPRPVRGNVNTLGWEDSASISLDGKTLGFMETSLDVLKWVAPVSEGGGGADPATLTLFQRGASRGRQPPWSTHFYVAPIRSRRKFLTCKAALFPFSDPSRWEWAGQQAADGSWSYVSADINAVQYDPDIYRDGVRLSFNSTTMDDDPHFDSDSGDMFFWSVDRPGAPMGVETIWLTHETAPDVWTEPVPLPAPINLADSDQRQPHLAQDGYLYYSSSEVNGQLAIYRARRTGFNTWEDKERLIGAPSRIAPKGLTVIALGEPTLTAAGDRLVFVVVYRDPRTDSYDADIVWVK
ncbi:MAG: hypothetical protein ACE5HV_08100 [Acidobacteriota bacterium]